MRALPQTEGVVQSSSTSRARRPVQSERDTELSNPNRWCQQQIDNEDEPAIAWIARGRSWNQSQFPWMDTEVFRSTNKHVLVAPHVKVSSSNALITLQEEGLGASHLFSVIH